MSQTIRSQLRGTATSKNFRYAGESPQKGGKGSVPSSMPSEESPTKISKSFISFFKTAL